MLKLSYQRLKSLPACAWVPLSNESTKRWTESTADQVLRHIKVSVGIKSCTVIKKQIEDKAFYCCRYIDDFHCYHTQTAMQSKDTSRAGIYNVICETRMGPCKTHIFGHLFRISPRLSLRKKPAYIRDLNSRIYGLKAHTYPM